ncbi:histidine kinase [Nostoc linckia]|nr:histidine kinase [Nostoc linckia]
MRECGERFLPHPPTTLTLSVRPMPNAQCPMPHAQCPTPHKIC